MRDRQRPIDVESTDQRRSSAPRTVDAAEAVYVIELQGKTVGMACLRAESASTARLERFYLDPSWQRTAVFERLVACVYEHCVDRELRKLSVDATVLPGWVRRCLGQHGFRLVCQEDERQALEFAIDA
jgi:N-acetylglutamate synthase-like GNAT family acetyltransferase